MISKHKFIDSGLHISFNKKFKHIKLQKLERVNDTIERDEVVDLEYDLIELTFSKEKEEITLHTSNNVDTIIVIIWEMDKEDMGYKSYMFTNKNKIEQESTSFLEEDNRDLSLFQTEGLQKLFKKMSSEINPVSSSSKLRKNEVYCHRIKNENISAEIRRR